jgi:glycosyltransferase involved in cell wall biosynthesis
MTRALATLGHRVFVITVALDMPLVYLDKGVKVFRIKPRTLCFLGPLRVKLPGFVSRLEYSYAVSKKIRELLREVKIDIIESCEARAEGFWYYFNHSKPALVIKLHTPEGIVYRLNRDGQSKDRSLIEKLEEWWLSKANRLIGLSSSVVELTGRYCRAKLNVASIVPNPIDSKLFVPLNVNGGRNVVLYTGRLEFRKGVHVLIRAVPMVLERYPDARFIFVGDDCGMKDYILKKVNEFNMGGSVELISRVPRSELVQYYQHSSVCVAPSLWENHPYAVLEAMACGKPVVATRVGGVPEIISNENNGILVEPGSVIGLSKAIIKLLLDHELATRIGNSARKTIEQRYTTESVARKTTSIYEGLLLNAS